MMPQQPPSETPKSRILFTATALFDGMTWADLRAFVKLGEDNGVRDSEKVDLYFENDDYFSPLGLEVSFRAGE